MLRPSMTTFRSYLYGIDDLLHTVYVGSEGRHDDPVIFMLGKIASKVLPTVRSDGGKIQGGSHWYSHIITPERLFAQLRKSPVDPPVHQIPAYNRS